MKNNYKAKLFYERKQKEHKEKFGVYFDTNAKHGQIIQEYHNKELKILTLYGFLYNSCIFESAPKTISIHYTEEGAEKALKKHKNKLRKKWREMFSPEERKEYPFGKHEYWGIHEINIKP